MLTHPLDADTHLGPLEPWQAAELFAHVERHRAYLDEWIPIPRAVTDLEAARRFLVSYAERQIRDEGRIFGIWHGDELVGGTVFRTFSVAARTCELGVWIAPEHAGRGLVTRACTAMIDWAVHDRGIVRVEWRADTSNTRSIAVAKRLGMRCEGVLRAAAWSRGRPVDVELWAVLAQEWRS
jgi:ribosomal-protein-serine acetyltransferase